ncbi:MAG: hypothetical protein HAW67_04205 [Endozoicomonadaceae bacterium]|nr:hypothetical protein [Endozoicomonadaceae bacterium]
MTPTSKELQPIGALMLSILIFLMTLVILMSGYNHQPKLQNIMFDMELKSVQTQDLNTYASHSNGYRKGELGVADYVMHAMMVKFDYDKQSFTNGEHRSRMFQFYTSDLIDDFYDKDFQVTTFQKTVIANNLIVKGKVLKSFKIAKQTDELPYEGISYYSGKVRSYAVEGTLLVETYGDEKNKQIYEVYVIVQRALIEDFMSGYSVTNVRLEEN